MCKKAPDQFLLIIIGLVPAVVYSPVVQCLAGCYTILVNNITQCKARKEKIMDTFEEYYEYVGAQETTDQNKLLESFKLFLEHPDIYGGFFVVRWKENDVMHNNTDLKKFTENCYK